MEHAGYIWDCMGGNFAEIEVYAVSGIVISKSTSVVHGQNIY